MAFNDFETADGSPVEIITFQIGSDRTLVTNAVAQVVLGADTFEPLAYSLTPFAQSKDTDDNNRTMVVPTTFSLLDQYDGPRNSTIIQVTVERFHLDDAIQQRQILWIGRLVNVNYVDKHAELILRPETSFNEVIPQDTFSSLCNAFLYQTPGCELARDDWRYVGVATSITNGGLNIEVAGLRTQAAALDAAQGGPTGPLTSDELDLYWQGGYIETDAGEIRDIVEGDVGGAPDVVRVNMPFRDLIATDGLTVYAGCPLSRTICHKKFDNVLNFQGFPDIPEIDPANTELPTGDRRSPSKFAGPQV